MIDHISGDGISLSSLHGGLEFIVVHDLAEDGESTTRILIDDVYDLAELVLTAIGTLRHRLNLAEHAARAGRPHELDEPDRGRTTARAHLLWQRLLDGQAALGDCRTCISGVLAYDAQRADREPAAG